MVALHDFGDVDDFTAVELGVVDGLAERILRRGAREVEMERHVDDELLPVLTLVLIDPVVREDAHTLYGFGTLEERSVFRQLIRISGIGARTALSVLSGMSVADLAHTVAMQDAGPLTRIPGIGKKTAERLLLELKGKLAEASAPAGGQPASDVVNALVALGYSDREALVAVKGLAPGLPVAEAIRAALKALAKS